MYVSNFPGQSEADKEGAANGALLERERADLLSDLRDLPRVHVARQVNEFVKRMRYLRIHCLVRPTSTSPNWVHARPFFRLLKLNNYM